jgi:predicted phosphodiesterase
MAENDYVGLLVIGDPHLEGRQPGFRKDDYPTVILEKLAWCLDYAITNRLLPVILGDLFDKPRDNPNWVLGRLIELLRVEVIGLYGNHDVHYHPELTDDDSFSLLVKANRIRIVSGESSWRGRIGGQMLVVGGSSYRQPIPDRFSTTGTGDDGQAMVIWLTHHDINVPGYDEGWITPREIEGIDLVINGHIHRTLANIQVGKTLWVTPGNISRRTRSEAARAHVPSVLRIDVTPSGFALLQVEVPHRPHEDVFYEAVIAATNSMGTSAFVAGLADLQARRTAGGAGLMEFLEQNLNQFEPIVADEIMNLAMEVTGDGQTQDRS